MNKCQTQTWPEISQGEVRTFGHSLRRHVKRWLKRHMSQEAKRKFKIRTEHFYRWIRRLRGTEPLVNGAVPVIKTAGLKAGDVVRVRSQDEINSMLNSWHEMKGCLFMPAMWEYCGTVQVVLKPVERFVDERDYRVKHARGLVILQGLLCSGSPDYGRCDRACFYFWREEWLEKISESELVETAPVVENH